MQNYVIYDNAIVKPVSEIPAEIVKIIINWTY